MICLALMPCANALRQLQALLASFAGAHLSPLSQVYTYSCKCTPALSPQMEREILARGERAEAVAAREREAPLDGGEEVGRALTQEEAHALAAQDV